MVSSSSDLVKKLQERHKLVAAAYIVFRKSDGKLLLLKRANTGYYDGYYSLPAGHLEGGETAAASAVREAREEVGVSLEPQNLKLVHAMHRKSINPLPHERIDFYFEVTDWQGEPVNLEPHKCDELKWVSSKDLPTNMVPEVKQALQMVASGELYSDFGFSD